VSVTPLALTPDRHVKGWPGAGVPAIEGCGCTSPTSLAAGLGTTGAGSPAVKTRPLASTAAHSPAPSETHETPFNTRAGWMSMPLASQLGGAVIGLSAANA
jgi:hypothetical protein